MKIWWTVGWMCLALAMVEERAAAAAESEAPVIYEVLPHEGPVRGHLWLSDGPGFIHGQNQALAHRFRLGGDLQFGPEHRVDVGWTVLDEISSRERNDSVGHLSREGSGPRVGYYFLPERLWLLYTYNFQAVRGSRVSDSVGVHGHELTLGYRFYTHGNLNLGVELSYLTVAGVSVPVLDASTNTMGTADYPGAQIWTLNVTLGFEVR